MTPDQARTPLRPAPAASGRPSAAGRLRQWWQGQRELARRPRLDHGWASRQGCSHERNQDAVLAAPPLYAVADGVGGGSAGELASSQMLALFQQLPAQAWQGPGPLSAGLQACDGALAAALQAIRPGSGLSATTFVGARIGRDGRGLLVHVGDARALLLSPYPGGWQARPLTRDQTYAEMAEPPPSGGRPDDPARMLGVGAAGQPPVQALQLQPGQLLLLCSDGLHRHLPEASLAHLAGRHAGSGRSLAQLAQQLALAAEANGSTDDISVLLLRRNHPAGVRPGFWWALLGSLLLALAVAAVGLAVDRPDRAAGTAPLPAFTASASATAEAPVSSPARP